MTNKYVKILVIAVMVLQYQPKQRKNMLLLPESEFQDFMKTFEFGRIQILLSPFCSQIKWFELNQKINQ